MTSLDGTERVTFSDSVARKLYRYRGWVPVLPILAALIWADPRRPWWVIGIGCMFVGEALRCWGAAHLGLAARSSRPLSHKLATSGPFARTRHPLYWGNACLTLGFVTTTGAGWPWFVGITGLTFLILYVTHARREERALARAFPDEHAAYRAQVPAWWWRLVPARITGAGEVVSPSLSGALRVELGSIHAELWLLILLWLRVRLF